MSTFSKVPEPQVCPLIGNTIYITDSGHLALAIQQPRPRGADQESPWRAVFFIEVQLRQL